MIMSREIKTHKDLDVWKRAINLITYIYKTTSVFPISERYGLTYQIRKASVSIAANISEGSARRSRKELIHFLYISLGSVSELETLLIAAGNLQFCDPEFLLDHLIVIRKQLLALIKSINRFDAHN